MVQSGCSPTLLVKITQRQLSRTAPDTLDTLHLPHVWRGTQIQLFLLPGSNIYNQNYRHLLVVSLVFVCVPAWIPLSFAFFSSFLHVIRLVHTYKHTEHVIYARDFPFNENSPFILKFLQIFRNLLMIMMSFTCRMVTNNHLPVQPFLSSKG